jgi:hypothetical protein
MIESIQLNIVEDSDAFLSDLKNIQRRLYQMEKDIKIK